MSRRKSSHRTKVITAVTEPDLELGTDKHEAHQELQETQIPEAALVPLSTHHQTTRDSQAYPLTPRAAGRHRHTQSYPQSRVQVSTRPYSLPSTTSLSKAQIYMAESTVYFHTIHFPFPFKTEGKEVTRTPLQRSHSCSLQFSPPGNHSRQAPCDIYK